MASKFLLQGVTTDSHLDEVRDALQLADIERVLISVAFLNQRGFALLADLIKPVADKTTVFVGIRNGITSGQGLLACIECGCATYAVDTGSRSVTFHPKIFLAKSAHEARIVLGSANLTVGGLNGNIEAGLKIAADLAVKADADLVEDLVAKVDGVRTGFPQHVFQIRDKQDVMALLKTGRLTDENRMPPPTPSGSSTNRDLDKIPKMELKKKALKYAPVTVLTGQGTTEEASAIAAADAATTAAEGVADGAEDAPGVATPSAPATDRLKLVWTSKPLTRRALNIPTAGSTNPTGSMFFTRGATEGIDQRHYFREEVFADLPWFNDTQARKTHLERATGRFRLVIKDVNYGVFLMGLTHDSRTDSAAYRQNNSVTQLHWGEVKPKVAREDLLARTMYLYRDEDKPDQFVLEID
ncbi:MAG: phospholipase D family protein [Donghicola eburneus]|nr:phospholipase D family protein [Donghicola eburneus]MBY8964295.1 phospholipase D family protein [Algiphilus acroporae]MCI5041141.1 phospholipase D family protein [Donghicola eburneus]